MSQEMFDPEEGANVVHFVETLMGLFKNAIGENEVEPRARMASQMYAVVALDSSSVT